METCSIPGCETAVYAATLCRSHYDARRRKYPARACIDCGAVIERKPGKGAWPKRCPEHQRAVELERSRAKTRQRNEARKGQPRPCIKQGCDQLVVPPLRLCEAHQLCEVEGCARPKASSKLCNVHKRLARTTRLDKHAPSCGVEGMRAVGLDSRPLPDALLAPAQARRRWPRRSDVVIEVGLPNRTPLRLCAHTSRRAVGV